MIHVACGAKLQADDRKAGRKLRCPKCQTSIEVPQPVQPSLTMSEGEVTPRARRLRRKQQLRTRLLTPGWLIGISVAVILLPFVLMVLPVGFAYGIHIGYMIEVGLAGSGLGWMIVKRWGWPALFRAVALAVAAIVAMIAWSQPPSAWWGIGYLATVAGWMVGRTTVETLVASACLGRVRSWFGLLLSHEHLCDL